VCVCVPLYIFRFSKNMFVIINCTRLKSTLGVIDVEKRKGDYLVHLCYASESAKDEFLVCMLTC
jgi:hydrogenase maturation factor